MPHLPLRFVAIFIAALFLFGGRSQSGAEGSPQPLTGQQLPPSFENTPSRHVRFRYAIRNGSGAAIEHGRLAVYAPAGKSATFSASLPFATTTDPLGNHLLQFTLPPLPPFASTSVLLEGDVPASRAPQAVTAAESAPFLLPAPLIESDRPELMSLAATLHKANPRESARAMHDWVSQHLRYSGYRAENRGALAALAARSGDCTEYMTLFIALCRADGIPARGVAGFLCAGDCLPSASTWHNWSEVLLDGAWRIVDPQKGNFLRREEQYLALRLLGFENGESDNFAGLYKVEGGALLVALESGG